MAAVAALVLVSAALPAGAEPPRAGADRHTIALWLFDEPPYPGVTLTDVGPLQIDLRLDTGREPDSDVREGRRGLVSGKFGRALALPLGGGLGVTWPESSVRFWGTSFILDRTSEVPERCNLGYLDFTIEFWFKALDDQAAPGVIWEVRNEVGEMGPRGLNALLLDAGRKRFLVQSKLLSFAAWESQVAIPTDAGKLGDGQWHHSAFTFTASERQMRHYLDGRLQPLPEKGTFLPLMGPLVSMRLGRDADGNQELAAALDEMRISGVVQYARDFTPPESLSRNSCPRAPGPGKPNGPPLAFAYDGDAGPRAVEAQNASFSLVPDALRNPPAERVQAFDRDPRWAGQGNQAAPCDFAFRADGHAAGGAAKGEIAGTLDGSQRALLAEPVGDLDLAADALAASGRAAFVDCRDGDVVIGWFNRASYDAGAQFPDGIFMFLADKHRVIVNYVVQGVIDKNYSIVASAKGPFDWKLQYDPAAAGRVRLELGSGESATLEMAPGDRQAMARLDHFGVVTRHPGGVQSLAFDDLRYTAGQTSVIRAARWAGPAALEVVFRRALVPESVAAGCFRLSGAGRGSLAEQPDSLDLAGDRTCRLAWKAGAGAAEKEVAIHVAPAVRLAAAITLGSRKHVFLDDALIERMENVRLAVQLPLRRELTDFRCDRPWEPTPRFGPGVPDVGSVWDDGDRLRMIYTNGGMWGGKAHAVCLAESADGLHWTKPELGVVAWDGSTANNIVLRNAAQGCAMKDPNPDAPAAERYKYIAWCMNRGFYVFTSPDAVHWRRNESVALPFDPDGSISAFWDDQCGLYRGYLRALLAGNFRGTVRAETREILRPWPFAPAARPQWHVFDLPKPSSGELPLVDTGGEAYRFQGVKYPGAPDAYLAFPWRYVRAANVRPGSFLMVSRDGEHWRRYEELYYFPSGWKLDGRDVLEALVEQGLVLRGDEVWQYGTVRFTEHGGVLYRGKEHEGGYHDRLVRLVQRLDGFVALEAGATPGTVLTRPLKFAGRRLVLNVAAKGAARVGLTDEDGQEIPGHTLAQSDVVRSDSVRQAVTWQGRSDVGPLAGKAVRLRVQLQEAKLFACQFVDP